MTVTSESSRTGPYIGNGVTTIFDYDFRILDEDHISVIMTEKGVETILTLGADYIVSGVGASGGGSIETISPPTSSQAITILRSVPFVQETDLENQGQFFAQTIEDALDLAVMRDQQLAELVARSVRIPAAYDVSAISGLIDDILRLADSADNIDAVAGVAADISAVAAVADDVSKVASIAGHITSPLFQQAGSGAVTRTMQDKARDIVSIKDFGAVGNGVADDSGALSAAAGSANGNGVCLLPTTATGYNIGGAVLFKKSLGLYDFQGATDESYDGIFFLREAVSNDGGFVAEAGQRASIKVQTSITNQTGHPEVGVFSIVNSTASPAPLEHVAIYGQANAFGANTAKMHGLVAEVAQKRPNGLGGYVTTSTDHALVGVEADVVSGYDHDYALDLPAKRKSGVTAVSFGGHHASEAFAVYSPTYSHANPSNYFTGDFAYGFIARTGSIDKTHGRGLAVQSDHGTGLELMGKSTLYGINLAATAENPGNVGININANYSVAIALQANRAIKMNGAGGSEMIYYDPGNDGFAIDSMKLELLNQTLSTTAAAGAVALPPGGFRFVDIIINGSACKLLVYNP